MKREIGSSFYKINSEDKEYGILADHEIDLKDHFNLYYSGRSALLAILEDIHSNQEVSRIWVPKYYCHNVTGFLERNYNSIKYYNINPFEPEQSFLFDHFAGPGEVIILNNYWGLFTYEYDSDSSNRPVIIEDHSHGWLSPQSLNSKADYCLASVRKSYPLPCGGLAWKPGETNSSLAYEEIEDEAMENAFITLTQSNMKKRKYLKHGKGNKESYLNLLKAGEKWITESNSYVRPNKEFYDTLARFIRYDINLAKSSNLEILLNNLKPSDHFRIITREGYTPFGLLLLFKDESLFSHFKAFCIQNDIYPANLWPNNDLDSPWKYFFNIHIDFRYDENDMKYLANCVNEWSESQVLSTI